MSAGPTPMYQLPLQRASALPLHSLSDGAVPPTGTLAAPTISAAAVPACVALALTTVPLESASKCPSVAPDLAATPTLPER